MMVMTAKVDFKKIAVILAAIAGVILAIVLLFSGGSQAQPTSAVSVSDNDSRVQFLKGFGWEVSTSPTESGQVRIPKEASEVYDRYNALQKSQGYDLSQYAGKTVMRYVYKVNNFPGATEPVYATLLVHKNKIIGGDITNTAAKGAVQGFRMQPDQAAPQESTPAPTDPSAPTDPTAPAENTGSAPSAGAAGSAGVGGSAA